MHVSMEWKLYSLEAEIQPNWYQEISTHGENTTVIWKRIDEYWNMVLSIQHSNGGDPKYPCLGKLVRAACVLSHGNADVERSFSFNKNIVSSERTLLSEKAIVSIRHIKDIIKVHDYKPQAIKITPEFVKAVQESRSKYQEHLKEEKHQKNKKQHEPKVANLESIEIHKKLLNTTQDLNENEKSLRMEMDVAQCLLDEASKKLSGALQKGNLTEAKAAQVMLQTGNKKIQECLQLQKDNNSLKRKLIDKQNEVITTKLIKKNSVNN